MTSGKFIVFEGGEGAGKSTQVLLLAEALRDRSCDVVLTREPGGTPGAEAIRSLLLGTDGDGWNPRAEALLFAAARSDHVERLIRPSLTRGCWVLCDRFIDSSRAYQGRGLGLDDSDLMGLHRIGSGGLVPDLTVLLEISTDEAEKRVAARDCGTSDRIGGRGKAFHAQVAIAFRQLAAAEPGRYAVIDGAGGISHTHEQILAAVIPLLSSQ